LVRGGKICLLLEMGIVEGLEGDFGIGMVLLGFAEVGAGSGFGLFWWELGDEGLGDGVVIILDTSSEFGFTSVLVGMLRAAHFFFFF
jgi:hypothetical protein